MAASAAIVTTYVLWLARARRSPAVRVHPAGHPPVLIVVPVFDEAALIGQKLENLAALTYRNCHVVIVDGGSGDGTLAQVTRWIAAREMGTMGPMGQMGPMGPMALQAPPASRSAALSTAQSAELSTAQSAELSKAQSAELSTAQNAELSTAQSGLLSMAQSAELSTAQSSHLSHLSYGSHLSHRSPQVFELLSTTHRNKTAQLTAALHAYPEAPWILVTDADALLPADTLERLLDVVAADPRIGVVGARVRPTSAHALEALHWKATDWLRERESDRGSAAIVAAPCYLARREFLASMPIDTVADDVHVACRAMVAGQRVGHADATVLELRSPRSLGALLRHKYRKADAYLREIVRFLPSAPRIASPMRAVFLWRAALLTVVPLLGTLAGVAFILAGALEAAVAIALLLALKPMRLAAVLAAVSAVALLTYPFSRQAASFPKISEFEAP
jgi:cellulose synthase/poly-beta-1,6-N-acetylglucosamine synthase-like glycosyltransferase